MTSDRVKKHSADPEHDYFELCVESVFSPQGGSRYRLPAERSADICKHESAVRRKLGLPDATSDELVRAWRLRKARDYCSRRRDRAPRTNEPAGRVVFAHDSERADALRELVAAVNQLSAESAGEARAGRAGMIAALQIVSPLLGRIPGADLVPIISTLNKLEQALRDLDHGIVHAALKKALPQRRRGRPKADRRRDEFRRRCVVAALLSELSGDNDPFEQVFEAARDAATVIGPFKTSERQPPARDKKHPGAHIFSPNTVQKRVQEYKTERNKAERERRSLSPAADAISDAVSLAVVMGTVEFDKVVWIRSLSPENIERSMSEIGQDVMRELNVRRAPATGLVTRRIDESKRKPRAAVRKSRHSSRK